MKSSKIKATAATETAPAATETAPAAIETAPKNILQIIEARYGVKGNMVEVLGLKVGRKASNRLVAVDPAPKVKKILEVKAAFNGVEIEKTFNEGEFVTFPEFATV